MDMNRERDDLTKIKGIGAAYQQWLRESLGIYTFEDLAALTVDELESRVKAAGRIVSRDEVAAWISQARELAGPALAPTADLEEPEGEGMTNSPVEVGDWKPTASFVVEFQARELTGEEAERRTVVHHVESDTDAEWPGIESVALCHWMLEQLGEPALDLAEETRAQAREQLEQELEEIRADARKQLDQELEEERSTMRQQLEEERSAMRQEMEKERQEVRLRAQQTLQRELAEQKARAQQALEEELTQSRAEAEATLQRELEEARARAEETLQRELERERTRAQQELDQSLKQKRLEAKAGLELELEEYQREAKRTLDQQLEQARAEAEETLQRELAETRSQALQELDQELAELRAEARRGLEEERAEARPEISRERAPAPEKPPEEARLVEREEAPAVLKRPPYVNIVALRAVQSSHTYDLLNGAEPETSSVLEPDRPFTLEASFELGRDEVAALARQGATYVLQSYARDVSSGTTTELGTTPQTAIVAGKQAYTAQLPNVTLSSGHYEFVIAVTVQSSPPGFDIRELPALAVT